jgi:alpha-tubulin suppressor-like RCC1 family protein
MEDGNFELVMEYSDVASRKVYREEAKAIEELRKGIIEISGKEEPYDIFICYKETDENGQRTLDSVLAQDIYDALTEKDYRVFFSRITLEDKLGQAYEPYIFAALHSARIMLAVGTDYEYYNAVWVKNEWSRFLQLIASGEKKTLIPCYKNIDAYDMPKEFAKLQAQDLGKVGATQDLLRGIEKIIGGKSAAPARETDVVQSAGGSNVDALLKRGYMALEDCEWDKAAGFFEEVLNQSAECAEAYLGKAMAALRCPTTNEYTATCENDKNFQRARQFATGELQTYLCQLEKQMLAQKEKERIDRVENIARLAEIRAHLKSVEGIVAVGYSHMAGLKSDGTVVAARRDKYDYGQCNVSAWHDIVAICVGSGHTVGLKSDGTVVATGAYYADQCNVSAWRDIVDIRAGSGHTVGLKSDGTVVAVGDNKYGQCNISDWRDIIAICTGDNHTVGLQSDGTVMVVGDNKYDQCIVWNWHDIVAISASHDHTVGLKSDGTVVAVGRNDGGQCDTSTWRDIVAISAGDDVTAGLRSDGTVVVAKDDDEVQYNVSTWRDIVAISAAYGHVAGLRSDGSVVVDSCDEADAPTWRDIVAIGAGKWNTVGLKSDGTVMVTESEYNLSEWKLFGSLDTLEDERKEAAARAEQARKAAAEQAAREWQEAAARAERERKAAEQECQQKLQRLQSEQRALKTELANLKGLFSGKRRKEIEAQLQEIERSLSKL